MRVLSSFFCMFLVFCGCNPAATTATDAGATTDSSGGTDVATGTDIASGSDGTSETGPGSDGVSTDGNGTDSGLTGPTLFLNEINAGGAKKPTTPEENDWAEIYNAGKTAVDLSGYKIGGTINGIGAANELPAGSKVEAGGFFVVWFNTYNLGTPNIAKGLKSDGTLGLWDKGGTLVDSVDWKEGDSPTCPPKPCASYDRVPDGSSTWKTVAPNTPGAPNSK